MLKFAFIKLCTIFILAKIKNGKRSKNCYNTVPNIRCCIVLRSFLGRFLQIFSVKVKVWNIDKKRPKTSQLKLPETIRPRDKRVTEIDSNLFSTTCSIMYKYCTQQISKHLYSGIFQDPLETKHKIFKNRLNS